MGGEFQTTQAAGWLSRVPGDAVQLTSVVVHLKLLISPSLTMQS